jgi:hypothetical protein
MEQERKMAERMARELARGDQAKRQREEAARAEEETRRTQREQERAAARTGGD